MAQGFVNRIILCLSVFAIGNIYAQTPRVAQIKQDASYYWGEGEGSTISKADQGALAMLSEQISVSVESSFELIAEEEVHNSIRSSSKNPKTLYKEFATSMMKTHSRATLQNTERVVVEGDPNYVFRYIRRNDVVKIFEARRAKAQEFYELALQAERSGRVREAMKYYYWSLGLLKSHPDGMQLQFVDRNKQPQNAVTLLTRSIESILNDISFSLQQKRTDGLLICVRYKGNPIESCDFQYHLGDDWSEVVTCRDGYALLNTFGASVNESLVQFRIDYMFENQWHIDDEVREVMEQLRPVLLPGRIKGFTHSYSAGYLETADVEPAPSLESVNDLTDSFETSLKRDSAIQVQCARYYDLLQRGDTLQLHQACTDQGWQMLSTLLQNGQSNTVLSSSQGDVCLVGDSSVQYRNIPMQFKYRTTQNSVVEHVVLRMNELGRIESVAFGVNKALEQAIMNHTKWNDQVKLTILNFIENYQTAYALKRLDYLEQIFDDNALIITGTVLKPTHEILEGNNYYNVPLVRSTRHTKTDYLMRLRNTFRSNEYIQIRFADISIVESKVHENVFGIRMRQDYYSSSYGDSGWLFLMVDLRNPEEPIIHVRVWQQEKDPTFGWADIEIFD